MCHYFAYRKDSWIMLWQKKPWQTKGQFSKFVNVFYYTAMAEEVVDVRWADQSIDSLAAGGQL